MSGVMARLLPCGTRLHLQHGPIDLVIGAEGARAAAFAAAKAAMSGLLQALVDELDLLREPIAPDGPAPAGPVARRMHRAALCHAQGPFVTPMAAVAGSVADHVLLAMTEAAPLSRAYVNNGGDIALHLDAGTRYRTAIADATGLLLGQIDIAADDCVRGIATSGRHGRSLSRGIADSVTVIAPTAAAADVAATLIANAVDLPGHPAICRRPACSVIDGSDLGSLPVVTDCGPLGAAEIDTALAAGHAVARGMIRRGLISGAALFLQGRSATTRHTALTLSQRTPEHA